MTGDDRVDGRDNTSDDDSARIGELIRLYLDLGRRMAAHGTSDGALNAVTAVAVDAIPGVHHASVTLRRDDDFETRAPTDTFAAAADRLQYELNSGPCVDSVREDRPLVVPDVATDTRWPEFGPLAARRCGVGGMLSTRLVIDADTSACLNLYSDVTHGFTDRSQLLSLLLSTHAAAAISRNLVRDRGYDLRQALEDTRRTAMAIGVVMSTRTLTKDQAFDLLRIVSQASNRRMPVLVEDVLADGAIAVPGLAGL